MVDKVESIFELWKDNDDVEYDCDDASINSHIYASTSNSRTKYSEYKSNSRIVESPSINNYPQK